MLSGRRPARVRPPANDSQEGAWRMGLTEQVLLTALTPGVGLAVLTWFGTRLRQRVPERRRWRLKDPYSASICIAQSVTTNTGAYERPSTGVGQARALAVISPSLVRAYSQFDTQRLCFPDEFRKEMEQDVIVLGGPKNNEVAARILQRLEPRSQVKLDSLSLTAPNGVNIPLDQVTAPLTMDHGVVARITNPYSAKPRTIILLSGAHTYGVVAAARYFVQSVRPLGKKFKGDFIAVVESDIHNGHVLPPRELYYKEL
ncbi:hypothetical protein Ais01nite_35970 [Asanoa ishikariensis]|nr:hypothetical protein Ais01nite_35970 [Asanoa ishikariensis]